MPQAAGSPARLPASVRGASVRRLPDPSAPRAVPAVEAALARLHGCAARWQGAAPPPAACAAAASADAAAAAAAAAAGSAAVASRAATAAQPDSLDLSPSGRMRPAPERPRRSPAARAALPRPDFYAPPPRRGAATAAAPYTSPSDSDPSSDASSGTAEPGSRPAPAPCYAPRTAGAAAAGTPEAAGSACAGAGLGPGPASGGAGLEWAPEAGPALELLADAAAADAAAAAGARSAEALQVRRPNMAPTGRDRQREPRRHIAG